MNVTNDWTEKVWGRTRCVYDSEIFCGHELEVEKLGYCSVHYHMERMNRFVVQSGVIAVVMFWGWKTHTVFLTAGDDYRVPSLVVHQFLVYQTGNVYEEYSADRGGKVCKDDIVRLNHGGKVKELEQFKTLAKHEIRSFV